MKRCVEYIEALRCGEEYGNHNQNVAFQSSSPYTHDLQHGLESITTKFGVIISIIDIIFCESNCGIR